MKSRQSNTQKAVKGISSQTLVTVMLGLVEIISFSIMSRLLSVQDFGYYAAMSAILVVFNSFAETGIGSAIIHRKEVDQKFINNAFTLALSFGVIISLSLFFLSDYLAILVVDESMGQPLKLMSLTILCHCMTSPYVSVLQKKLKFMTIGYVNLISLVVTTIIAIILAYNGFGYYAIIAKVVSGSVFTLILSAVISKVRFSLAWDKNIIKSIWNYSGWLMASVIFRNFSQQADRLLMSKLLSVEMLGSYNRPKEFINQISSKVNGIFDTALFPVLSTIQDNMASLQRSLSKSVYFLNLFSIYLAVAFIYNAEFIIRIFFGIDWLHLVGVFQLLCVAIIFNIDGRLSDCYLRSLGLTKAQFYFRILETIVKFGGVIIGAQYGIYGVSIAVVFANFVMIFIKLSYITRHINYPFGNILMTIIHSWKSMLIFIPVCVVASLLLPSNIGGDIVKMIVFVLVSFTLFLVFPSIIGKEYKEQMYPRVITIVKKRKI